jgi:hypothetical protein
MRVIRLFMNKVDQERKVMSTRSNQETVTALAVSIERGAAMVGVTPRHFRKQLDTEGGPIRTVRMGNRVLIPVDELRNYLKPAPTADEAKKEETRARGQRRGSEV